MNAAAKTVATVGISLAALNLTAQCEQAFEFEYLDSAGRGTGVLLTVIGSKAPKVQEWVRKHLNRMRSQEQMQMKRGKDVERLVEDDEEFAAGAAAIRLIGWKGITEPYTPELAIQLCTVNSEIRDQIFKASNDLANFMKG